MNKKWTKITHVGSYGFLHLPTLKVFDAHIKYQYDAPQFPNEAKLSCFWLGRLDQLSL